MEIKKIDGKIPFKQKYKEMFVIDQYRNPLTVPRTGLICEYLFSGNYNDTSGNGHNGTVVNTASLTTDKDGNANSAFTTGSGAGYLDIGDIADLEFGGDFTINKWISIIDNSTGEWHLGRYDSWSNPGFCWMTYCTANYIGFLFGNGSTVNSKTNVPASNGLNNWHMVTIRGTSSKFEFFFDANYKTGYDLTRTVSQCKQTATSFKLGNGIYASKAKYDRIRIYNRALTNAEILQLFNE